MSRTAIFTNETANGNTKFGFNGGLGLIVIWGNFDGCKVDLSLGPLTDDSVLIPVQDNMQTDIQLDAPGIIGIAVAPGFDYYLTVSSVGASTDINADIGESSGVN